MNNIFSLESEQIHQSFPFVNIEEKLGEGGQKHVYKAKTDTDEVVAFKLVKLQQQHERVLREIEAASKFSSPRFPTLHRYGKQQAGDHMYIFLVEEYIDGISLRTQLNAGAFKEEEAVRIGIQLLLALCEVAQHGLVHRDVKPENIMLGPSGRVVLLDFGIARHLHLESLTQDMAVFGPMTVGYGSPEQIRNEKRSISSRSDLFACGVVMYEMLTGENPFTVGCSSPNEVLSRTLQYIPPKLRECKPIVSDMIHACLQKMVHRRPAGPDIVLNRLLEVFGE